MVCEYEIEKEGMLKIMRINCRGCKYYPSLADHRQCMESTVNKIIQSSSVDEIIFEAERNYIYDRKQTNLLNQIARAYIHLFKTEDILKHLAIPGREKCSIHFPERLHLVRRILLDLFKGDPIGAYVEAVRSVREQKATIPPSGHEACIQHTINVLSMILNTLEQMDLIKMAKPYLAGYVIGDRSIYRKFFEPQVKPSFMYTRLVSEPPIRGEEITSYKLGVGDEQSIVSVFKLPNKSRLYYHILPPEFRLGEEEYTLLEEVRDILIKYKPRREEFTDPDRMREIFFNVARDLLEEVAKNKNITLTYTRLNALADMLVRLTVGLGLVEVILQDEAIEDVYINAPAGTSPIFVKHAEYGECETNIIPNPREIEAWTSRFRMISGRPLDEANPVLDMSLNLNNVRVRISTIQQPLSPYGYGIAFRRHRARPWTLPLLIKHGSLSPMAAGLISFLIDGARTFLVAGTRGAGKTSLLSAMMVEIMRRYRVITVEDTLELPTDYLKNLGYNIQPMKV
ncbi:MAG TPA: hypothetical protein ENG01_00965, partial [Candidatus Aenigmarchaeota archaeon]|nr:hypothetical protein [Candidatus Aenigmarchaeota archaeon]HEX32966.1 hypothetical protein [Candidatus Aenigmarchaeota archaeon]